jgi:L-rhamnose mutarotase
MQRLAFRMQLRNGNEDEYKKRHDEIWEDLKLLLKQVGIEDYSIFLDEQTNTLFGVLKSSNPQLLEGLPQQALMKKWWLYMKDIMECNEDNSPVTVSLKEVFYLA